MMLFHVKQRNNYVFLDHFLAQQRTQTAENLSAEGGKERESKKEIIDAKSYPSDPAKHKNINESSLKGANVISEKGKNILKVMTKTFACVKKLCSSF